MGLLTRAIEEFGISTVYVGSAYDMMAQVKPPRPVFVNFPLGHQCGKPFDRDLQMSIIKSALGVLAAHNEPGQIEVLPFEWDEEFMFNPKALGELPADQMPPERPKNSSP